MAVTATRSVTIQFSGDIAAANTFAAANNAASPAEIDLAELSSGNNTITPPTGSKGVTIVPPTGNTVALTIRGATTDTGIAISLTDPTSLGLAGTTAFVINAASGVNVRLIWS